MAGIGQEQELDSKVKLCPSVLDAVAVEICALYPRRHNSIWKQIGQKRWAQWTNPLSDFQLLGVMSDEGRGLYRGCYWGEHTKFGVLDIDQGSRYHTSESLQALNRKFRSVGLELVPYQSSDSGGWHLYFFFDEWALSDEVCSLIKRWLKAGGYEIKSGTLEVFPSGNALRLPLQQGFAWLSENGKLRRRREELTGQEALVLFHRDMVNHCGNWSFAKSRIEDDLTAFEEEIQSKEQHDRAIDLNGLEKLFARGLDWEKYARGRDYWLNGLTAYGQRHDAVICIGHYLWYGDGALGIQAQPGQRNALSRSELIWNWLLEKHRGFSKAFNAGAYQEIRSDIERACCWTNQRAQAKEFESYVLTDRLVKRLTWLFRTTGKVWTVEELQKANDARSIDARQRITEAVAYLKMSGQLITKAAVAERAKASRNTVLKHIDLLAGCSGEYSGGLRGALQGLWAGELLDLVLSSQGSGVFSGCLSVSEICRSLVGGFKKVVAPLAHVRLNSLAVSSQRQALALRVLSASLPLGPKLTAIQPLGQGLAGAMLSCSDFSWRFVEGFECQQYLEIWFFGIGEFDVSCWRVCRAPPIHRMTNFDRMSLVDCVVRQVA